MENNFTVYCHIAPNNKKYIGITSKDATERWHNGLGYKNNQHFQSAINKYGWDNIQHIILADSLSKDWACKIEQVLIRDWKLQDSKYGYNICGGGSCSTLGLHHSDETREKLSKAHIGKHHTDVTKAKMSLSLKGKVAWNKGKHHTAETIEKMRVNNTGENNPMFGRHLADETKAKISATKRKNSQNRPKRVWVNNGVVEKLIYSTNLECGYTHGRLKRCMEVDYVKNN